MSRLINIIEIDQPHLSCSGEGEVIKGVPERCKACNGAGGVYNGGWIKKFKQDLKAPDWVACKVCKGTGELIPSVVVRWQSNGVVKEQFKTID